MKKFFLKIYTYDKAQALKDILESYETNGYVRINFMYFSYIQAQKLYLTTYHVHQYKSKIRTRLCQRLQKIFSNFDITLRYSSVFPSEKEKLFGPLAHASFADYHQALLKADFLLPDGIALQVSYFLLRIFHKISGKNLQSQKKLPYWLYNLNGTDFIPYFFSSLSNTYGAHKINVILYGSKPEHISNTAKYFKHKGIHVLYYQDGYSEFNRGNLKNKINSYQDKINILLVARSTPQIPIQEIWVKQNIQHIKELNLISFTVGGLFDHLIGVQKRAPKLLRWIKMERLWRLITHPKRNYKKVVNIFSGFKYIFYYLLLKIQ